MSDDIIGKTFGRIYGYYSCESQCGTIKPVKKGNLLSGESLSCGCYTVDIRRLKALKFDLRA